jgi:hypothetical protein
MVQNISGSADQNSRRQQRKHAITGKIAAEGLFAMRLR